jgi:hypothetical protein
MVALKPRLFLKRINSSLVMAWTFKRVFGNC